MTVRSSRLRDTASTPLLGRRSGLPHLLRLLGLEEALRVRGRAPKLTISPPRPAASAPRAPSPSGAGAGRAGGAPAAPAGDAQLAYRLSNSYRLPIKRGQLPHRRLGGSQSSDRLPLPGPGGSARAAASASLGAPRAGAVRALPAATLGVGLSQPVAIVPRKPGPRLPA
jgi:hypothetical protein